MTLADSYLQNCFECGEAYSRAESFCPYCGTPSGVEFELGIGAVLYEDRPDTPDDERRLHHVTDRRVSLEDGDVYYVIWDGTHTRRYHYHAEDVLADFAPAGWQWPTGRKPTYWLTRHCGVDDEMDLMTDGGVDQSTSGIERKRPRGEDVGRRWDRKASENMACWGIQHPQEVLSAIDEEVGEVQQAYLEATHEGEPERLVEEELDDLGPLLFQLVESLRNHPMAFEPLPTAEEVSR